ncbi:hypothetical protein [Oceanivirga salmonicida]|uniref:hypothetical protein n=1 Tax=Oceanivirga salmonicida TaxID=1769291 RepID=UPI00082CF3BA|nr:hypothetical protein [Oceanivirga salmonicida]
MRDILMENIKAEERAKRWREWVKKAKKPTGRPEEVIEKLLGDFFEWERKEACILTMVEMEVLLYNYPKNKKKIEILEHEILELDKRISQIIKDNPNENVDELKEKLGYLINKMGNTQVELYKLDKPLSIVMLDDRNYKLIDLFYFQNKSTTETMAEMNLRGRLPEFRAKKKEIVAELKALYSFFNSMCLGI